MASGLLAPIAAGIVSALEIIKGPHQWRHRLPTLAVCVVLAVAGLLLMGSHYAAELLRAQSPGEFLSSLGNNLTWPIGLVPWLAPLSLLPLLTLAFFFLRSPGENLSAERILLGIGVWTVLQAVATAYARGKGGVPPEWRYMDTLAFLFIANILSVALLLGKYRTRLRWPLLWCAVFAVWLVPCLISLWGLNQRAWEIAIPRWGERQRVRLESFRVFMATDDASVFANRDTRDMPFVYVPELTFLVHTKDIRSVLPACARDSLKMIQRDTQLSAFIPGGTKLDSPDPLTEFCLGSYTTNGAAARGTFESAPLSSSLPYVEIPVAGNLGRRGLNLQLVELASGRVTEIKPFSEPGGKWMNLDVKAPSGKFKLVAHDDSPTAWFAFKEPREMGRLSFWAEKTIGMGRYVLYAGCLSFVLALFFYLLHGSPVISPANSISSKYES
jgi:hypothetical protein